MKTTNLVKKLDILIASVPTVYSLHSPSGQEYRSNIGVGSDTLSDNILQKFELNTYSQVLKFIEKACLSRSKVIIVTSEFMIKRLSTEIFN